MKGARVAAEPGTRAKKTTETSGLGQVWRGYDFVRPWWFGAGGAR